MKKITFAMLSKLMMLTLMVCSAFSVSAQDVDLGAMTLNTVYDCPVFKSVKGSFTPETDGVYKINYSSSDRFGIFTDAEMTIPYENGGDWAYYSETIEGMKSMGYETWNFVGGTTYYLGGGFGEGLFIMNSNAQLVITTSSSEISLNSVTKIIPKPLSDSLPPTPQLEKSSCAKVNRSSPSIFSTTTTAI